MIMIHGQRNGLGWHGGLHQGWNWTDGDIAVTNVAMEEIWRAVPDGTPITINPIIFGLKIILVTGTT